MVTAEETLVENQLPVFDWYNLDLNKTIHSVNKHRAALIKHFLSPADLKILKLEFQKLLTAFDKQPQCRHYEKQTILELRPNQPQQYSLEGGSYFWGHSTAIASCQMLSYISALPAFTAILQAYYNKTPFLYPVRWQIMRSWGTPANSQLAPYTLHFDRQHFFKFFIYLTDVTPENGPLSIVLGEHHFQEAQKKRKAFISTGNVWSKMDNNCIENPEELLMIPGKAGDMVLFDSSLPHKQAPIKDGALREAIAIEAQSIEELNFAQR